VRHQACIPPANFVSISLVWKGMTHASTTINLHARCRLPSRCSSRVARCVTWDFVSMPTPASRLNNMFVSRYSFPRDRFWRRRHAAGFRSGHGWRQDAQACRRRAGAGLERHICVVLSAASCGPKMRISYPQLTHQYQMTALCDWRGVTRKHRPAPPSIG
jgi:hypothetical protein